MNKVLITGANKGIGFGISKHLALKGWHVLVGARNKERAEKAIQELKALGAKEAEWVAKTRLQILSSGLWPARLPVPNN